VMSSSHASAHQLPPYELGDQVQAPKVLAVVMGLSKLYLWLIWLQTSWCGLHVSSFKIVIRIAAAGRSGQLVKPPEVRTKKRSCKQQSPRERSGSGGF
jgi:hypothetical protein